MGHIFRNSLVHFVEKECAGRWRGWEMKTFLSRIVQREENKAAVHAALLLLSHGRGHLQF